MARVVRDSSEAVDGIAPDVVTVDHRSGVGLGFRIEGRDAFLENQIELRSSLGFSAPRLEWLAVRGGRHGLAKVTYVSESGFEVEFLETYEIDVDGRLCRSDLYDLADLDAAVAVVDSDTSQGEGAEHADRFRSSTWRHVRIGTAGPSVCWPDLRPAPIVDRRQIAWGRRRIPGLRRGDARATTTWTRPTWIRPSGSRITLCRRSRTAASTRTA